MSLQDRYDKETKMYGYGMYGPGLRPSDINAPLHSSIGVGPKGSPGQGITVEVVDGDPYGFYRLQFKNTSTGEVLITTPNLDPGSRIYLCDREFEEIPGVTSYLANIEDFATEQLGSIRNVRVGDLVMYKSFSRTPDASDPTILNIYNTIGLGVVTEVSPVGTVKFTMHELLGTALGLPDGAVTPAKLAETTLALIGTATDEQVAKWLDEHPEATTTVEDGAVTTPKLHDGAVTMEKMDDSVIMVSLTNEEIDELTAE